MASLIPALHPASIAQLNDLESYLDATASAGNVGHTGYGRGVAWADYDGDGAVDLR